MTKSSTKNKKNTNRASKPKPKSPQQTVPKQDLSAPWISMRTGIRVIAIASIFMAVLTAWQAIPTKGTFMGVVWGLLFGGMIWVIFLVFYLYGKYIRR